MSVNEIYKMPDRRSPVSVQEYEKSNSDKDQNKLMAYFELNDKSIVEVSKLCKEQMCQDVADKVIEILASNVVKCDKLKEECGKAKRKLEQANLCSVDAKTNEIKAINAMRTWRTRAIYLFLMCILIFALFMFAGDDVTRYLGQPGCLGLSESKMLYGKLVRYYVIYAKYTIVRLCERFMKITEFMIHYVQNNIIM